MNVAIIGSRDYPDAYNAVKDAARPFLSNTLLLLTGDARGVDEAVRQYAEDRMPLRVFAADWDTHGKAAGPIRNAELVADAEYVVALWDGKSRGTRNVIDLCLRSLTDLQVVFP